MLLFGNGKTARPASASLLSSSKRGRWGQAADEQEQREEGEVPNDGEEEGEEEEDDDAYANDGRNDGYRAFGGRDAKGILFKISPIDDTQREQVEQYVHGGSMDADLRFVREVHGLVDPSHRRDFDQFWESPWLEEHACDAARKRKLDARQRAMAARSYIYRTTRTNAGAADGGGGGGGGGQELPTVDRFVNTVDRLTEWVDRQDAKEVVKTVSRMIQSFERAAITTVLGMLEMPACRSYRMTTRDLIDPQYIAETGADITSVACTLRRSRRVFHLFAGAVSMELFWAEATNGARNTSIYNSKQLEEKRRGAMMALIRALSGLSSSDMPHDRVGLPLMGVRGSMCVSRGVLVVMPGGVSATYVLELEDDTQLEDLKQLRNIRILRVVS